MEETIEKGVAKLELKQIELPIAEVETVASPFEKDRPVELRVRLKGQRPENRFLLVFRSNTELIETIHDTKKRGGTAWVRFKVNSEGSGLLDGELVVRDLLE